MPPIAKPLPLLNRTARQKNMLASTLVCAREPGIRPDSSWAENGLAFWQNAAVVHDITRKYE